MQDEKLPKQKVAVPPAVMRVNPASLPQGKFSLKDFAKRAWAIKKTRAAIIVGVVLLLLFLVPTSRYFALNTVGVRTTANISVVDQSTGQPLKNVQVTIQQKTEATNDQGVATINSLKLGTSELKIERVAFDTKTENITIGLLRNHNPSFELVPNGKQLSFKTADYLSGNAIPGAEAISGEASAFANEQGEILLTIDAEENENHIVEIKADDKRTEKLEINTSDKQARDVPMVPARKHVYVSDRSGKYDVYAIHIDGQNREKILAGTGYERSDINLNVHQNAKYAALVSTRERMYNDDGYLLSTLTFIDLDKHTKKNLTRAEKIQVLGWTADKLVYVKSAAAGSAVDKNRQKIFTYNFNDASTNEIASSNYFNDVLLVGDNIFYAPSSTGADGVNIGLFKVSVDGNNREVINPNETWKIYRTAYDTVTFSVGQAWYDYILESGEEPKVLTGAPQDPESISFYDNQRNTNSLWTDEREGKGVLISHDIKENQDRNVASMSGLQDPAYWISDNIAVFRVKKDNVSSDYAVSLDGGSPKKITDVTASNTEAWYYY